jgi:catechol 2,3-dioxygenase-like lactoylglutathione lyase family enzyme
MIDLDHVAIGARDVAPHLRRLAGELGGTVLYGGYAPGCRWVVTRLGDAANGMNLELLEPWKADADPFLERFVAARTCGPHHITFVVDDIEVLIAALAEHGPAPVKQRLDDPLWREAFLHPDDAGGTVVQIADTTNAMSLEFCLERARCASSVAELAWGPADEGWWEWPGERGEARVVLERAVLATPDLDRSRRLYCDLLGGEMTDSGADAFELAWPGGARLRFELRTDRAPGVLRYDCSGLPHGEIELAGARLTETIVRSVKG